MNKKIKVFLITFFSLVFLFLLIDFAKANCYYFCDQRAGCDCGIQGSAGAPGLGKQSSCLIGDTTYPDCGWGTMNGIVDNCTNSAGTQKCQGDACPNESGMNGEPCIVIQACFGPLSCWPAKCPGKWDANNKWCVSCIGKKKTNRLGSSLGIDVDCSGTCNAFDIPDTFETACDPSVDTKCEDKFEGDACGTGGTCTTNGQCIEPPPTCPNGVLDPPAEQCDPGPPAQDAACPGQCQTNCQCPAPPPGDCELDCSCSCPTGIPCPGGQCEGGLVPCGRSCDDPCTKNCECAPCTFCHLFVLLKRIIDFLMIYIIFPVAVLMIVVGGVMYLISGGDPGRIGSAKKILTATVIGLVIILSAWLIVDTVIVLLAGASPFGPWNTINCPVCGDGNCDIGETNCPADCGGGFCGDGSCDPGEDAVNCPADCGAIPPPVCVPTFPACNGICPRYCTGADDPDCSGQCLDCTCSTDNDCTSNCAADNGCCDGCGARDPDCPYCSYVCDRASRTYCNAGNITPPDDPLYCSNCDHCHDSFQNCTETGIDCGIGSECFACAECSSGTCDTVNRKYCNGGVWTAQDDALYCSSCNNCVDGVKNCDETGTDCGGVGCTACAVGACSCLCTLCPGVVTPCP